MHDTPYSVITISATGLVLYGISLLLVRAGFITKDAQRKCWNVLLLIAIAGAGGLGLFFAVAVNYKIELPLADTLLVWHVDFGIALVLIAVLHFVRHFGYYRSLLSKNGIVKNINTAPENSVPRTGNAPAQFVNYRLLPFILGFISMASQLVLLREFISVFNGNELTISMVLSAWMLLTGLGAILGRKQRSVPGFRRLSAGLFVLSLLPFLVLFLLNSTRGILLPAGAMPDLKYIMFATIVQLSPFCLLSGWIFSALSSFAAQAVKQNPASAAYGWETLGSIASGALLSTAGFLFLEPFQNLSVMLLISGLLLYLAGRPAGNPKSGILFPAVGTVVVLAVFIFNADMAIQQFLFPGQSVAAVKDTPYGKMVVTRGGGQLNFYENNSLLFTTNNTIASEEAVHYAMLQRQGTGKVLLLGGGASGVAAEILKYPVKRLDYAEINAAVISLGRLYRRFPSDARFHILKGDPRLLVRQLAGQKDAAGSCETILLCLPEPSTLQANRFYTLEFFGMLKRLLAPGGVVSLSLMPTPDYLGSEAQPVQSTVYNTLKAVFNEVLVIAGEKNYFVASDAPLSAGIVALSAKSTISTAYVNGNYLDDLSLQERSAAIIKRLDAGAPLNRDFRPVACFRQLSYWLGYAGRYGLLLAVVPFLILMLAGAAKAKTTAIVLFAAGFVSFSAEMILLLALQAVFGYVYLLSGIFITLFMALLAAGVFFARSTGQRVSLAKLIMLQLFSAGVVVLIMLALKYLPYGNAGPVLLYPLFGLLLGAIAFATGIQFHMASAAYRGAAGQVAAVSYSADLLGSAAGAIIVNIWLLPAVGFQAALLAMAGIGLGAVVLMALKKL